MAEPLDCSKDFVGGFVHLNGFESLVVGFDEANNVGLEAKWSGFVGQFGSMIRQRIAPQLPCQPAQQCGTTSVGV